MVRFFHRLTVLFLALFLVSPALAIDLDKDGFHEIFIYSASPQRITVHKHTGEFIARIPLPDSALGDDPVLFLGQDGETPLVFSFSINATNEGRLVVLGPEGRIKTIDLGRVNQSSVVTAGNAVLYSNHKRKVFEDLKTVGDKVDFRQLPVRMKRRGGRVSYISHNGVLTPVAYTKKKSRGLNIYPPNGTRTRIKTRVPKGLLYPLENSDGFVDHAFVSEKKTKRGATFTFVDLTHDIRTVRKNSASIQTGYFFDDGTTIPQFAVANGTKVEFFSIANPNAGIGAVDLDFGDLEPPRDDGGSGGSGSSGGECNSTLPRALMNKAENQWHSGDYFGFNDTIQEIFSRNYCQETFNELVQWATDLTGGGGPRSAAIDTRLELLGTPVHQTGKDQRKLAGCDKIRPGQDGAMGFLYKRSDHGGTVILLPSQISASKVDIMYPTLKERKIANTRGTGRANGYRLHFRLPGDPTSYPRHLVVRAFIDSYLSESQKWCWEIKNSHVRND